jgi:hypothetical protein
VKYNKKKCLNYTKKYNIELQFFVLQLGGFGGSFVNGKQAHVADVHCDEQQSADGLRRKVCCVSI